MSPEGSSPKERPRRSWRIALRLLGPLLVVVVIWRLEDPGQLLRTLGDAALWPLLLAALLNLAAAQCKIMRWRVLISARGRHYALGRAWAAYLAAGYLSTVTPGRVGDVLRVQYLRHDIDMPYGDGLGIVVVDRLCDIYLVAAVASLGFARFAHLLTDRLTEAAWTTVAVVVLAPLLLLIPGIADRALKTVVGRVSKAGSGEGADRFLTTLRGLVGPALLRALPLTAAAFAINYTQAWIVGHALGLSLSWLDVTCLVAITSLLGLIPLTISGLGVREAVFALVFPSLGATAVHGVGFGLVVFVVLYLFWVVVGFVAWQMALPPLHGAANQGER